MDEFEKSWMEYEDDDYEGSGETDHEGRTWDEGHYDLGDMLFGRFRQMPRWGDVVYAMQREGQGELVDEMLRLAIEHPEVLRDRDMIPEGSRGFYLEYCQLRMKLNVEGDRIAREYRTLPCDLEDDITGDDEMPGENEIDRAREERYGGGEPPKEQPKEPPKLELKYNPPKARRRKGDENTGSLFQ